MILRYCTGIILLLLFCDSPKAQNPVAAVYSKALSPESIFIKIGNFCFGYFERRRTSEFGEKKACSLIVFSFPTFGIKAGIEGRDEEFRSVTTCSN